MPHHAEDRVVRFAPIDETDKERELGEKNWREGIPCIDCDGDPARLNVRELVADYSKCCPRHTSHAEFIGREIEAVSIEERCQLSVELIAMHKCLDCGGKPTRWAFGGRF